MNSIIIIINIDNYIQIYFLFCIYLWQIFKYVNGAKANPVTMYGF